jgi:hypothetical protein
MSKLYIFGIGGTGSRVLKSLTLLMAAGVKVQDDAGVCYEIVPIIIDPDHAAADLTRTVKLMQDYKRVRTHIDFNTASSNTFFNNDINLNVLSGQNETVTMSLGNTQNVDFKTYIGLSLMRDANGNYDANYALASVLFSEKNLDSSMDVGFKGNPNIGSVVLNQFSNSQQFINFAASFNQGDRIFIISSIFGGTGASGFPLLLKNLRAISNTVAGNGNVKDAPIGAISVLPYFDVAPDNNPNVNQRSQIESSTFVSKTKAALTYYDKNMSEANALYYIADKISKQYANSEGGTAQQNDAHFIELAAALSIVDFAAIPDENLITNNGIPQNTLYKEFGIKNETNRIVFSDLCHETIHLIKKPMTQFVLFCKYLNEQIPDSKKQPWVIDQGFDDSFLSSTFYRSELRDVNKAYIKWLIEMSNNNRSFTPFDLIPKRSDVFSLIKGENPVKIWSLKSNYDLFDDVLNSKQKGIKKDAGKAHRFIELFYTATNELVNKKFRM